MLKSVKFTILREDRVNIDWILNMSETIENSLKEAEFFVEENSSRFKQQVDKMVLGVQWMLQEFNLEDFNKYKELDSNDSL